MAPADGPVSRTELLTPVPAEALAALLDIDLPSTGHVPALWHWVYLLERRPQRELGPDGHPRTGVPAPPGAGRRRMFGGGRVTTHRLLRYDAPATRTTRLVREVEKVGASGPMTLTTVRTEVEQDGRPAVTEEQDIVYRAGRAALPARPPAAPSPVDAGAPRLELRVDPVLLFRFSALTYNAHRIHYDVPYAAVEGYPGLVVHGPLQALLMAEVLRRSAVPSTGATFSYRLVAPTFGAQRLTASWSDVDGVPSARVHDGAGRVTATATLLPADPAAPAPGAA